MVAPSPPPSPPPPPPPNRGLQGAFAAAAAATPSRDALLTPSALAAASRNGTIIPGAGAPDLHLAPPPSHLAAIYINQHVPIVLSLQPPNFSQWRTLFEVTFQKSGAVAHINGAPRPADSLWLQDDAHIVGAVASACPWRGCARASPWWTRTVRWCGLALLRPATGSVRRAPSTLDPRRRPNPPSLRRASGRGILVLRPGWLGPVRAGARPQQHARPAAAAAAAQRGLVPEHRSILAHGLVVRIEGRSG